MSKVKILFAAFFLIFARSAYGQFGATVVSAPLVETVLEKTHLDQIIYYAQMVAQQIEAVKHAYEQWQNMIRAEQRALENLKGIKNIKSFGDFMSWYNRQLYLERQAEQRFNAMGVKIGGTTYKVKDIDKIPDAAMAAYGLEYWDSFSDEQRRQMWYNLGLTPANYNYVQTWKEKEKEIAKILLTSAATVNEDNMESTERMIDLYGRTMNEEVGEKGVLQAIFEVLLDTNRSTRQANYDAALDREYQVARDKQESTPPNPPMVSDFWGLDLFQPISE